jgi:excisionase family DNA binding protein
MLEATKELGFRSENFTRRLVQAGTLRAEKVDGKVWRIEVASVEEYKARAATLKAARGNRREIREERKRQAVEGMAAAIERARAVA